MSHTNPLQLARLFHETYERLAPQFGYETRADTRTFDPESPNGRLMAAVCAEVFDLGARSTAAQPADRAVGLLREAVATLDMWADVAPAVSLRHDINRFLGEVAAAAQPVEPAGWKLTRSIIHECPALVVPQTWVQKLGMTAQLVVLKGADEALAQRILSALNAAPPAASGDSTPPSAPQDEYGSTDFGYTFAGAELAEGDKRLMALLVRALGTDHPAIDDMTALLFRARPFQGDSSGALRPEPEAAGQDRVDARRYRWLREALDTEQITERLHEAFQQGSTALDAAIDRALPSAEPPQAASGSRGD